MHAQVELKLPNRTCLKTVFEDLRQGLAVSDFRFDAIYPAPVRRASLLHWTQVAIARRAAQLLVAHPGTKVLDVGSGAGKFCLVGSLATEGFFTGVERRAHLVDLSGAIARRYGLQRVEFKQGEISEVDWGQFDAFYFYNPFIENLYERTERIDHLVELSRDRYIADVRFAQRKLNEARIGTRVVTYHGFGGEFPPGYSVRARERWGDDYLVLWIKEG